MHCTAGNLPACVHAYTNNSSLQMAAMFMFFIFYFQWLAHIDFLCMVTESVGHFNIAFQAFYILKITK